MASFNTGTTGSATNITAATAFTFTIPAGVATGDVMVVVVNTFSFTQTTPAVSTPTSGGGSWTQIGTLTDTGATGGVDGYVSLWWRVATASDPSSTFTMSWTGGTGGGNQFWWAASMGSYTGFYTASPIGATASSIGNNVGQPAVTPTTTTQRSASWGLQLVGIEVAGSGQITGGPATERERNNPGAGIDSDLSDTNGSAGAAGSSIGGGSFTLDHSSGNQWVLWTVELCTVAPPGGGIPAPQLVPPGLQSPMVLAQPVYPATQAPPQPPYGTPAPAPIPPGLQ